MDEQLRFEGNEPARFQPTMTQLTAIPGGDGAAREVASLHLFLRELDRQCAFAERSARLMRAAADAWVAINRNEMVGDLAERREMVWYHAQAFLASLTIVTRLVLAPAPRGNAAKKAQAKERAQYLQAFLSVDPSTWVLATSDVRDSLEHIDERLDLRTAPGAPEVVSDGNIIPIDGVHVRVFTSESHDVEVLPMRLLNLHRLTLSFDDEVVDIAVVQDELVRLRSLVAAGLAIEAPPATQRIGVFAQTVTP
jgi:hypothetical protein